MTKLHELLWTFFKIGAFTIGGGYAMIPLLSAALVPTLLTSPEMANVVALAQMTPGAVGLNCATYVGYTTAGIWGSVLATFAIILPSLIIMLSICKAYFWLSKRFQGNLYFEQTLRMLRFTVIGLIAAAALMLIKPTTFIDPTSWIIFALVAFFTILPNFAKNKVTEVLSHPILLIVLAGVAGYFIYR
jgi:chromate transporter